jgi:hypothetical protein
MQIFGWDEDKKLSDFVEVAKNLEKEGHPSRAKAVRYLIERCRIAEERLYYKEK